jgi:IS30 family transposase
MYHHLSLEEREKLYALKEQRKSLRSIAKKLGRSQSSLTRELKRNIKYGNEYFGNIYLPCKAQGLADKRASKQRYKAPLKEPLIFLYVRKHLRPPDGWTPEQIAGRLPIDHPGYTIDDETIYRYIYRRSSKRYKLWQCLPNARKKRMHKGGRTVKRDGKIPGVITIDLRPNAVNERQELGHWETDNIIGKAKDTTALSTTVERVTRFTILTKLGDRSAQTKAAAVTSRLQIFPEPLRQSVTIDNGKENTSLPTVTKMPVYACHAYHSWEKGTNENTNGRVRRDIPKGVSIDTITGKTIAAIEHRLNHTPRKCLGFLTPCERMNQALQNLHQSPT